MGSGEVIEVGPVTARLRAESSGQRERPLWDQDTGAYNEEKEGDQEGKELWLRADENMEGTQSLSLPICIVVIKLNLHHAVGVRKAWFM